MMSEIGGQRSEGLIYFSLSAFIFLLLAFCLKMVWILIVINFVN